MSITLQPWKLKLLSIPKSYPKSISSCTHAIVKNIFFPRSRDCLFSFTQNALELAVVADVDVVAQDFLSLNLEGLMVTDDVFCAFMVDDPDGIGNSGRRINELSALLSRNGISIFYISTHVTDFILVKEKRLRLVLPTIRSLFSLSVDSDCDLSSGHHSRGFSSESEPGSFPGSSFTSMNSFLHTPSSPSRYQSVHYNYPTQGHNSYASSFQQFQQQNDRYHPQQQSSTHFGSSFSSSYTRPSTGITIPFGRRPSNGYYRGGFGGRQHSESDSSSMDGVGFGTSLNTMSTSISQSQLASRGQQGRQPSLAESSFGDGIGRYFPKRHPIGSSAESFDNVNVGETGSIPAPSISENNLHTTYRINTSLARDGATRGGGDGEMVMPQTMTPMTPSASSMPGFGFFPSLGLMHETLEEQEEREANIKEQIRRSCPRSIIDDKLILTGLSLDYQAQWAVTLLKVLFYPEELPGYSSEKRSRFMSFTTTDEGTSLIADQEVLGYFEEHMLNMSLSQTPLRCIQVDLSTFGLDTYGLVYSMSNPLVESDINLLCLSTFRTANVLVQDADLEKAMQILSLS
ncbi:GATS protein-like 3 [Podila verticillata]|nr:GATS protein-like 3 [Podila verticillata]